MDVLCGLGTDPAEKLACLEERLHEVMNRNMAVLERLSLDQQRCVLVQSELYPGVIHALLRLEALHVLTQPAEQLAKTVREIAEAPSLLVSPPPGQPAMPRFSIRPAGGGRGDINEG